MFYELAAISVADFARDGIDACNNSTMWQRLKFVMHNKPSTRSYVLSGVLDASPLDFCTAHCLGCATCSLLNRARKRPRVEGDELACAACMLQCRALAKFSEQPLVVKLAQRDDEPIWQEGQLQQMLYERHPHNVARCVGNYETHRYFVRKERRQQWVMVKISLFIEQFVMTRTLSRHSSANDITPTSIQNGDLQAPRVRQLDGSRDSVVAQIRASLLQCAILCNRGSVFSTRTYGVDWQDGDFVRGDNVMCTETEQVFDHHGRLLEHGVRYVFIDFGNNVVPIYERLK
jgi:hypothetical protein